MSYEPVHHDLDTLVDSAPKPSPKANKSGKGMSKSERIRRYLSDNPEARNKDVAEALAGHGVKPADVGNVKQQLKKKAEGGMSGTGPSRRGRPPKTGAGAAAKAMAAAKDSNDSPIGSMSGGNSSLDVAIGLDVLDSGIEFVKKSGGVSEAMYALNVIKRIKSL